MRMKKIGKMKKILLFALMGFMGSAVWGQNPVVYNTGFEVGDDTAWTFYGGPNRWHIGTAVADSGSRSLYVSHDGGATNAYTTTAPTCAWAVKSLTLGGGMYRCSFRWRAAGESMYDCLRVALVRDKGVDGVGGDSVYVDMLMLTAKDSAAWCRLQEAFRAPEPMEAMQRRIDAGEDIVTVGRYRGGDEATDMRVVSYLNRTVSIIHAATADDMHAVLYANMENNIRNRTS